MKQLWSVGILVFVLCVNVCYADKLPLAEGDVVFQSFPSTQTRAIQLATRSEFSHVGVVLNHNGALMVYEAVGPVQYTPVESWIGRDAHRHFVAKRLKRAGTVLTSDNLSRLESVASTFEGKPYDFVFGWSDDKMYCSELVWKIFHRALNIDLGRLRKLKEFDLSSAEVQTLVQQRYPHGVPFEETVVSPEDIFASDALTTVYEQ